VNRAQRRYRDATVRPGTRGRSHTAPTSWAQNDAQCFKANRDQSHRARPRLPDEWFARPRPEPGDVPALDMVAVRTSADRNFELAIASASECLDCFDIAVVHDLEAIQQPHGDVRAAIRRAKRLFTIWLDHEARP
jgi:hypothetical protein